MRGKKLETIVRYIARPPDIALQEALMPLGVGIILEAKHLCMMMRGVEKQNSYVVTSSMLGTFRKNLATREEFLKLIPRRN